jgi:dipeptidyl-peptidase-3
VTKKNSHQEQGAGGTPRIGELERLGPGGREVLVLGANTPGFEDLPISRKIFAYHLYRAAIAGNDILFNQNHRDALEIKQLFETLYLHTNGLEDGIKIAVHDYLKFLWIHHGNYHHYTHTKFVPFSLTKKSLAAAIRSAIENGAVVQTRAGETLDGLLSRLAPTIFDPSHEPIQTNQSEGVDIVAESAVNFWDPGITEADINALPIEWQHKLNVRFARRDGRIVPETYSVGGVYGEDLRTVSHFLELALPYSEDDNQRRSIELLLDHYQTGDEELFRQHSVFWLKSNPTVDYLNGFIEQYLDPRGIIGNFEANVSYTADATLVNAVAKNALYFEERMPWPDKFKRSSIGMPVAKVVNVIVATGDAGPVSPAAYNLPNYNDLRRDHGSKNVILFNIENTRSQRLLEKMVNQFYLPEYRENMFKYSHTKVRPLKVYMHEVIGHGSGQPDPSLDTDPRTALGRVYSALEECRADAVALYHMSDPKLVEIGAFKADEQDAIVETAYLSQTQGWLTRYDHVVGLQVREAHNRGNQLTLMYLVENGGDANKDFGLDVVEHDGNFYVRITDIRKVREGLGELLTKLQILKSTGDFKGAAALFDRFGTHVNADWHRNMVERLEALNIPKMKAFVFPRLEPIFQNGNIVDVLAHHDEDLTAQQLRFSRLQRSTKINPD